MNLFLSCLSQLCMAIIYDRETIFWLEQFGGNDSEGSVRPVGLEAGISWR